MQKNRQKTHHTTSGTDPCCQLNVIEFFVNNLRMKIAKVNWKMFDFPVIALACSRLFLAQLYIYSGYNISPSSNLYVSK